MLILRDKIMEILSPIYFPFPWSPPAGWRMPAGIPREEISSVQSLRRV